MANNVFGDPITDHTLRNMPEYKGKQIKKKDRAEVALLFKNSGNKSENAKSYLDKLKGQVGNEISTFGLVYNATGDTITFVDEQTWSGEIDPSTYPSAIENGQWGAFLHIKTPGAICGSHAAVVYRCKNERGRHYDWVVAWDNPWSRISYENKVYTEIRKENDFEGSWEAIQNIVTQKTNDYNNHQETSNGCKSTVAIGEYPSPLIGCKLLSAVLTLAP
ncbi:hypothetical protein SLEP1_g56566 [Rubroshorea leprosula]|uniref:23 kDa jasmonate-induced protein-like n=1 Tax=Rubroshorea leprosula TaxID=152421 RepID=A0AAV5MLF2_9ROSI|nr:hypothetical protein SLEP1_g56566 [Rubroshorea leprosula]